MLVPELGPGDTVVMNNFGSHKGPAVRAAIEAVGHTFSTSRLTLSIEMAFSELKALLRKAAERTVEGLWPAI